MRAAFQTRYGPPDVVAITDIPRPKPKADELLVEVHASTVNRTDCGFRAPHPWFVRFFSGLRRPKARVLGCEFAGVVAAVGSAVTSFSVGDRVFGYRDTTFGGHAEYMTVAEDGPVATMPTNASFEIAAASTEGAHYALNYLDKAGITAGQRVLLYGATGAIGSAAVQLLKHVGADVTAVCATAHVDLVRGLGADRVIDYTVEDFTAGGETYDVVFDAVGKLAFARCRRVLVPKGLFFSTDLGPLSQNPFLALITALFRGRRVLFPIPQQNQEIVRRLAGLVESGAFSPVIDRSYPLEEIVEAYRYVETGQKVGNVVIVISA